MDSQKHYTLTVRPEHTNFRLDKFIAEQLPDFSRSKIQNLMMQGMISLDNNPAYDCAHKVKAKETYFIKIPQASPSYLEPKEIPLDIIFEDQDLIVLNKQAGLTTHPGAGNQGNTLVNALLFHCGSSLSTIGIEHLRPGIVHRLDKNTSGIMVVAKNDLTHASLAKQIQMRQLTRQYTAIVFGVPKPLIATINASIGRSSQDRKKMAVIAYGGKIAITHYEVIEILAKGSASIIKCSLETGRTHQIRVHLNHAGYSIVGDQEYGNVRHKKIRSFSKEAQECLLTFKRQALHSTCIKFTHPITNKILEFTAKMPDDLCQLIALIKNIDKEL